MFRVSSFRRAARAIAVLVLLAGSASLVHWGKDDLACVPGGAPDADGAAFAAASDTADHCLVCHWTRSLRSPSAAVPRVQSALVAADRFDVLPPAALRAPALDRVPARAPPHTL